MDAGTPRKMILPVALSMLSIAMATSGCAMDAAKRAAVPDQVAGTRAASSASALDLLATGIGDRRVVLLGEMHGTQEIPALTGDLVARFASSGEPIVLALEIDSREQARVDRYLASQGGDADRRSLLAGEHWQDTMHDGRDSAAMFALIERTRVLRVAGEGVALVLFDRYGEGDRDARMALALRDAIAQRPDARVVVLTGNVHAMVRAPSNMVLDGKPMTLPVTAGRSLADLRPLSVNISALGGESWICQQGTCAVHPYSDPGVSRAPAFVADAPDSPWDATLTLQSFTASPPAIDTEGPTTAR